LRGLAQLQGSETTPRPRAETAEKNPGPDRGEHLHDLDRIRTCARARSCQRKIQAEPELGPAIASGHGFTPRPTIALVLAALEGKEGVFQLLADFPPGHGL